MLRWCLPPARQGDFCVFPILWIRRAQAASEDDGRHVPAAAGRPEPHGCTAGETGTERRPGESAHAKVPPLIHVTPRGDANEGIVGEFRGQSFDRIDE